MTYTIDPVAAQDVTFSASDGTELHGTWYRAEGPTAVVVAFHQAGANGRSEYSEIASRLNEEGYAVLATDQRSGGNRFGYANRTVESLGESSAYCDVMPDIFGAIDHAAQEYPDRGLVLWGSSYSAALVLRAAARRPSRVVGVLAFSPASGGPMADCRGEDLSAQIDVPMLALRPSSEMARESSARQFALFESQGHQIFVADPGTHGSSMLVDERVGGTTSETWQVVLGFLNGLE